MGGKFFAILAMVMMAILMGAILATAQGADNEQLRKYYNEYISKCISKNLSKTGLQSSRSANLRSCGTLSKQKVVFLTNNQNMLVNEMIKKQIGTKPYKIEYYLNKRFHQIYH